MDGASGASRRFRPHRSGQQLQFAMHAGYQPLDLQFALSSCAFAICTARLAALDGGA
jgi:hypothetical protein